MRQARLVRHKIPAQSVMARVIEGWQRAPVRTPIGRFLGLSPLPAELRSAYRAVVAEFQVGEVLDQLGPRWDVLHDLPLRDGYVDHLVIGPAGVFAVQTVDCGEQDVSFEPPGALTIGPQARRELAEAQDVADEVSGILGDAAGRTIDVQPLLVLVEARRVWLHGADATGPVVPVKDLQRTLWRAPHVLAGLEVAWVSDIAERTEIWPRANSLQRDTFALHRKFAAIRSDVRSAIERRAFWLSIGFGLLCGVVWGLVAVLVTGLFR